VARDTSQRRHSAALGIARQRVRLGLQRTLRQVVLFGGAQYDGLTADVHKYERPAERHVRPWAHVAARTAPSCGVRRAMRALFARPFLRDFMRA
jgi:hypothetical protein